MPLPVTFLLTRKSNFTLARDVVFDYAARTAAAAGSVAPSTQAAMVRFVQTLMDSGDWAKMNRINLFASDTLAGVVVPLKVGNGTAQETNTGFVASDYSLATGLSGGSGKGLNTGVSLLNLNPFDFSGGGFILSSQVGADRINLGSTYSSFDSNRRFYLTLTGAGLGTVGTDGAMASGLCAMEASAPSRLAIYRNGVQLSQNNAYTGQSFGAANVRVMADLGTNFAAGVRMGGYYIGSVANQARLSAAWAAFNNAIGRA